MTCASGDLASRTPRFCLLQDEVNGMVPKATVHEDRPLHDVGMVLYNSSHVAIILKIL
jgi:hypothetical protein